MYTSIDVRVQSCAIMKKNFEGGDPSTPTNWQKYKLIFNKILFFQFIFHSLRFFYAESKDRKQVLYSIYKNSLFS